MMLSKAITLLCAATSVLAFQPGTVRAVPTLSLQRNAGLNLQSRSGGVARAAALRKQPPAACQTQKSGLEVVCRAREGASPRGPPRIHWKGP